MQEQQKTVHEIQDYLYSLKVFIDSFNQDNLLFNTPEHLQKLRDILRESNDGLIDYIRITNQHINEIQTQHQPPETIEATEDNDDNFILTFL